MELPRTAAQHWPAGLYFNISGIEREYFDMFFFSALKSYKGAFHMSPDYSWWYGYAEVLGPQPASARGKRMLFSRWMCSCIIVSSSASPCHSARQVLQAPAGGR